MLTWYLVTYLILSYVPDTQVSRVGVCFPLAFPVSLCDRARGFSCLSRSWETQPVWQNLSSFSAAYTQCMTVVVRQHVYFGSSKNYSDKRHTNLCLGIASTRILIFHFFQLYFLKTGCHFFSFFFFCMLLGNCSFPPALLNHGLDCWKHAVSLEG